MQLGLQVKEQANGITRGRFVVPLLSLCYYTLPSFFFCITHL
uniref:Uncharacterized protein n=1 Tax=Arundo donax TaxID=35708 RepID=A0A0A9EFD6_ARUDO